MVAGASASRRARQEREAAEKLMRRYRQARELATRYEAAAAGEQAVAELLGVLTDWGWHLLVDRRWPGTDEANVDMIMVGPGGVFVIDVKCWRDQPQVVGDRLVAGARRCDDEVRTLEALTQLVDEALAELNMAPTAIVAWMVFVGRSIDCRIGRVELLGSLDIVRTLLRRQVRLRPDEVRAVVEHLAEVFPEYDTTSVDISSVDAVDTPRFAGSAPAEQADSPPLPGMEEEELVRAQLHAAMMGPLESWMTFLHPSQLSLVRQRWGGPARISGAAGTGKTVVGLHRAAYLAHRSTGKILYVTFVRNLPRVQAHVFERLAPEVASRVEFLSLHAWALALLKERGHRPQLDGAEDCFSRAWIRVGRNGILERLDPSPTYWRDEIGYVIKGRDISDLRSYLGLPRPGRRTALRHAHKQAVWDLYLEYERIRQERGVADFADVLSTALAEVRHCPVVPGYSAVIVDEVQDLTLTGVRLLHAVIGDVPNGLLLIGDGQQAVYPGGFHLADAGITIRGAVLRVNYRNRAEILRAALKTMEGEVYEDIDGTTVVSGHPVEAVYNDGQVIRVVTPTAAELDAALQQHIERFAGTGGSDGLAAAAILCARKTDVQRYQKLLAGAGIPVQDLESYDGRPSAAVKVGTYLRAKGLEFKHVYLPRYDEAARLAQQGGVADSDRLALAHRQLFVGMTRARDLLWLGSVGPADDAGYARR